MEHGFLILLPIASLNLSLNWALIFHSSLKIDVILKCSQRGQSLDICMRQKKPTRRICGPDPLRESNTDTTVQPALSLLCRLHFCLSCLHSSSLAPNMNYINPFQIVALCLRVFCHPSIYAKVSLVNSFLQVFQKIFAFVTCHAVNFHTPSKIQVCPCYDHCFLQPTDYEGFILPLSPASCHLLTLR